MVQTLMKKDKVVCKLYLAEARDGIQKFSKLFFFSRDMPLSFMFCLISSSVSGTLNTGPRTRL